MRRLPQRGFSRARRRMRSRTCVGMRDRPGDLLDRHFQVQYRRQAVRCQRMTVSGWTRITADCQRDQSLERNDQNRRSAGSRRVIRLAGKDGELLSEGNILQDEVSLRSKGGAQGRAEEQRVRDQWQASVEKYCLHVGQIRSVRQPPLDTDDILPPYSIEPSHPLTLS